MASSSSLSSSLQFRCSISTTSKLTPASSSSSCSISFPPRLRSSPELRVAAAPPRLQVRAMATRQLRASTVTKGSWDKLILNSEVPILVEFYATWCGPCRMVQRIMDEIAEDYDGKIKCFLLNTDDDSEIASNFDIKAVPVVMLFKDGKKHESVVGTMPKEFYVAAIDRVMAS